jgi:hypothetical protein
MDEYFFGLPYIDPMTGQEAGFGSYIVPVDESPSRQPTSARSYEEPWYVDTINRAIERAAQVATLEVAGYPPYPPGVTPQPLCGPSGCAPGVTPQPGPSVQPQQSAGSGIQLSQTTLMLIVGGFLLFTLGKRGR